MHTLILLPARRARPFLLLPQHPGPLTKGLRLSMLLAWWSLLWSLLWSPAGCHRRPLRTPRTCLDRTNERGSSCTGHRTQRRSTHSQPLCTVNPSSNPFPTQRFGNCTARLRCGMRPQTMRKHTHPCAGTAMAARPSLGILLPGTPRCSCCRSTRKRNRQWLGNQHRSLRSIPRLDQRLRWWW